jgi:hypothetical protein
MGQNLEAFKRHIFAGQDVTGQVLRRVLTVLVDLHIRTVKALPGAYRLCRPSDGLTIWYTVTESPDG